MPSVPGPHTGILREENIVLRQIFGYRLDEFHTSPDKLPQLGGYLPGTCIRDVLIVCIKVDAVGGYKDLSPGQTFRVGISLFDTRVLKKSLESPRNAITSYQFINNTSKPAKRAANRFTFGETELTPLEDISRRVLTITKERDYVLVGHGIRDEIKFFNDLNPKFVSDACYIIDTVKAAQFPLRLYYRYSLKRLLDELGVRYARLDAAGNGANFTLKALLRLALRDGRMGFDPIADEIMYGSEMFFGFPETVYDEFVHDDSGVPVGTVDSPPQSIFTGSRKSRVVRVTRRWTTDAMANLRAFRELPFANEMEEAHEEQGEGLDSWILIDINGNDVDLVN